LVTVPYGSGCSGFQTVLGSGYTFSFNDGPGSSSSCTTPSTSNLDNAAMCLAGMTGVASASCFGAGLGFTVNEQADGGAAAAYSFPAASTGITYAVSALSSTGTRLIVALGPTTTYCVILTETTGTVAWTQFNTTCYNNEGAFLTGPPAA
jgi:hypothetical protein